MTLISRLEQAEADEQYELLQAAWFALNPQCPNDWVEPEWLLEDRKRWVKFLAMLDCDAFESAAMALVPEGWAYHFRWNSIHKNGQASVEFYPEPPFAPEELLTFHSGKCATPALALVIASLKAAGYE